MSHILSTGWFREAVAALILLAAVTVPSAGGQEQASSSDKSESGNTSSAPDLMDAVRELFPEEHGVEDTWVTPVNDSNADYRNVVIQYQRIDGAWVAKAPLEWRSIPAHTQATTVDFKEKAIKAILCWQFRGPLGHWRWACSQCWITAAPGKYLYSATARWTAFNHMTCHEHTDMPIPTP